MAGNKRKQDYDNAYIKSHYARIQVLVPLEWRNEIAIHAKAAGLSVNAWCNRAIAARIAAETAARDPEAAEGADSSGTE